MKLFSEFTLFAPNQVFASIIFGVLAGFCYSGLIPLVMLAIQPNNGMLETATPAITKFLFFDVSHFKVAMVFMVACLAILIFRSTSEIMLVRVANHVAKNIRQSFYNRISAAPLAEIERIGSSKLITAINIDVPRIVKGGSLLPEILVNIATLLGMLGFIFFLNGEIFYFVIYAIFFGSILYKIVTWFGARILRKMRETQDELQESIRGLIYGTKELKLDINKRNYYHNSSLIKNEQSILKSSNNAQLIMHFANSFGDLICFFVIGAVGFVFVNYHPISQHELVGVVMALLYLTGPIATLLNSVPNMLNASISYRKLNNLITSMKTEVYDETVQDNFHWDFVEYRNVSYSYQTVSGEKGFKVGPINLTMKKGEVIFMVGANGSGKSTLAKLFTLHYLPTSGEIYYGDRVVDSTNIVSRRMGISAIYTDYHLFDTLLHDIDEQAYNRISYYLSKLGLADKVRIIDGKFSTVSLSDGQRKRIALLVSFLEDKPVYLFDEWAADQDPEFKYVFYHEILTSLKEEGKLVIVISHDEQYFNVADRVILMEQGQLKESHAYEKENFLYENIIL